MKRNHLKEALTEHEEAYARSRSATTMATRINSLETAEWWKGVFQYHLSYAAARECGRLDCREVPASECTSTLGHEWHDFYTDAGCRHCGMPDKYRNRPVEKKGAGNGR